MTLWLPMRSTCLDTIEEAPHYLLNHWAKQHFSFLSPAHLQHSENKGQALDTWHLKTHLRLYYRIYWFSHNPTLSLCFHNKMRRYHFVALWWGTLHCLVHVIGSIKMWLFLPKVSSLTTSLTVSVGYLVRYFLSSFDV